MKGERQLGNVLHVNTEFYQLKLLLWKVINNYKCMADILQALQSYSSSSSDKCLMLNNISCNSVSMVLVHIIIFNGYLDPIAVYRCFFFLCVFCG